MLTGFIRSLFIFASVAAVASCSLISTAEATEYTTLIIFPDRSLFVCYTQFPSGIDKQQSIDDPTPFVWALEYPQPDYATIHADVCNPDVIFKNGFEL